MDDAHGASRAVSRGGWPAARLRPPGALRRAGAGARRGRPRSRSAAIVVDAPPSRAGWLARARAAEADRRSRGRVADLLVVDDPSRAQAAPLGARAPGGTACRSRPSTTWAWRASPSDLVDRRQPRALRGVRRPRRPAGPGVRDSRSGDSRACRARRTRASPGTVLDHARRRRACARARRARSRTRIAAAAPGVREIDRRGGLQPAAVAVRRCRALPLDCAPAGLADALATALGRRRRRRRHAVRSVRARHADRRVARRPGAAARDARRAPPRAPRSTPARRNRAGRWTRAATRGRVCSTEPARARRHGRCAPVALVDGRGAARVAASLRALAAASVARKDASCCLTAARSSSISTTRSIRYRRFVLSGFAAVAAHLRARAAASTGAARFGLLARARADRARGREMQVCLDALGLPAALLPGPRRVIRTISRPLASAAARRRARARPAATGGWRSASSPTARGHSDRKVAALGLAALVDTRRLRAPSTAAARQARRRAVRRDRAPARRPAVAHRLRRRRRDVRHRRAPPRRHAAVRCAIWTGSRRRDRGPVASSIGLSRRAARRPRACSRRLAAAMPRETPAIFIGGRRVGGRTCRCS